MLQIKLKGTKPKKGEREVQALLDSPSLVFNCHLATAASSKRHIYIQYIHIHRRIKNHVFRSF